MTTNPANRRRAPLATALLLTALAALGAPPPVRAVEKTLAECITTALEKHPSLKAANASVTAADQRVLEAASGYLPQVGADYSASRQKSSVGSKTGVAGQGGAAISSFYNTQVSFSQLLFDFGQTLASIRAAQASARSVEADFVTQRDNVIFNVKQSYYNLLAARRLLAVADETVRQTNKQLEQAQGRHDVGLAPKFDVTRAEVQVANAKLNLVTARNAVAVARETLRNAMGLNGPIDFDIVDTLDTARVHIGEDEALDIAYADRPELRSLLEQQTAQAEQITSLQRQYLPSVNSSGSYQWTGNNYPLQDSWNIGASVTLSIINGGLTTFQISEAKATLDRLKYNEQELRQNVALQVRQAVLNIQQADESIGVAEKGAQEARESLQLAEGRYNTGVGNIIELTDAQTSLTSAEANVVQALVNYQVSVASLELAMGKPIGLDHG